MEIEYTHTDSIHTVKKGDSLQIRVGDVHLTTVECESVDKDVSEQIVEKQWQFGAYVDDERYKILIIIRHNFAENVTTHLPIESTYEKIENEFVSEIIITEPGSGLED